MVVLDCPILYRYPTKLSIGKYRAIPITTGTQEIVGKLTISPSTDTTGFMPDVGLSTS